MISKASLQRWLRLDEVKAMLDGEPRIEFEHAILLMQADIWSVPNQVRGAFKTRPVPARGIP